jgi:hypothetical protein
MGLRARRAMVLGPVLAVIAVAGCGGSVHLGGRVPPPPGHQAPANAVSGLVQHLIAGGDPLTTCSYVQPGEEGNCLITVSNASGGGTGTWRLGHIVISGKEAIVTVELGHVCFSSCSTNLSPDAGQPRHGQSFGTAFERTQGLTDATGKDYAFGCVRIGRRWYVELGVTGLI